MRGQIRNLKRDKRFGFIRDEAGRDRFFHANNCLTKYDEMIEGQDVEFRDFELKGLGLRADQVRVIS